MRNQTTSNILMVRPANFAFNEETAASNAFQSRDRHMTAAEMRQNAMREFDEFVARLRHAGVRVIVADDTAEPVKPDAVFPNNWVTFHQEGLIITYPMFAPIRRLERQESVVNTVLKEGFDGARRVHLENNEARDRYLEGTGSIIFDHVHRLQVEEIELNVALDGVNVMDQRINSGVNSNVFTSVDVIDEVRVITSPADAEFGRGSGQVLLSIKSGGNQFHGSLFE